VSGVVGAGLGGAGGGLIYFSLMQIYTPLIAASAAAVAGVFTMGVFYVNSVIPSYGVGGTIEGIHDPKFKRVIGKDVLTSFVISLLCGVVAVFIAQGMIV